MAGELIHVSTEEHEVGRVIPAPSRGQTDCQTMLVSANLAGAEGPLETGKPGDAQSRLTAHYAFDSIYYGHDYGSRQYQGQTLFYYELAMVNPTKVPMAMVDAIRIAAGTDGLPGGRSR